MVSHLSDTCEICYVKQNCAGWSVVETRYVSSDVLYTCTIARNLRWRQAQHRARVDQVGVAADHIPVPGIDLVPTAGIAVDPIGDTA
jgi:hypothetical protein